MTRTEMNLIVKSLMWAYGDKFKINQDTFNVWYECMNDLRFDVAKKAVTEYIRKSQYAPTVADVRNEYNILWEEYLAMVRRINESFDSACGYYPCITEAQRASGRKIFMELVSKAPRNQREREARDLSEKAIKYVKECEAGTSDNIMAFDEYMRTLVERQ